MKQEHASKPEGHNTLRNTKVTAIEGLGQMVSRGQLLNWSFSNLPNLRFQTNHLKEQGSYVKKNCTKKDSQQYKAKCRKTTQMNQKPWTTQLYTNIWTQSSWLKRENHWANKRNNEINRTATTSTISRGSCYSKLQQRWWRWVWNTRSKVIFQIIFL